MHSLAISQPCPFTGPSWRHPATVVIQKRREYPGFHLWPGYGLSPPLLCYPKALFEALSPLAYHIFKPFLAGAFWMAPSSMGELAWVIESRPPVCGMHTHTTELYVQLPASSCGFGPGDYPPPLHHSRLRPAHQYYSCCFQPGASPLSFVVTGFVYESIRESVGPLHPKSERSHAESDGNCECEPEDGPHGVFTAK